jgi:outer membrane biosynthesis protein TonB
MMLALGLMLALWAGMVPPAADAAQSSAPAACVKLARSEPFPPDEAPLPKYPEDAKAAGVEGDVTFHMEIGSGCAPDEVTIDDGPEALRKPVEDAVKGWKYCGVPEGQEIRATVAFRLNCAGK